MSKFSKTIYATLYAALLLTGINSVEAHCGSHHQKKNKQTQQTCATEVRTLIKENTPFPYNTLYKTLNPFLPTLQTDLQNVLSSTDAIQGQANYTILYNEALLVASQIPNGRVLIALPDGTVVVDTTKSNNTYANFKAKAINENHNSRISILDAQLWPCGEGVETKFSSSDQRNESYVALRLGPYLASTGTSRLSVPN